MAAIPMPLSDLKGHFLLFETSDNVACIIYSMFINLLKALPNVIFHVAAQQLTRLQLTVYCWVPL